jgi:quinol monooxygenase YgiN
MGIVIVAGHARMAPGEIDRLLPAMEVQIAASNAEEGCLHYSFARHVNDPDLMIISERWKDRAALDAHFKEPHMAVFNKALGGAKVLDISVKAYEDGAERVLMGG